MVPIRLALIDDHRALCQGLELLLGHHGCVVVGTAGDGAGGLAVVREHEPDVTVVGVSLGGDSGIALARDLVVEDPGRAIVLYGAERDTGVLLDGLDAGARGYALKEGAASELLEAIRCVADGGVYVDPRLRFPVLSHALPRSATLSEREREIMQLLAEGHTGDEVAERLFLSSETVKTHIRNAVAKLEARNRVHAIAIAVRDGLIGLSGGPAAVR